MLGVDTGQFVGRDLRDGLGRYAISQRGVADFEPYRDANPDFDASQYHEVPVTAVRTRDLKYVHSTDRSELFDLPDETTRVGSLRPDRVEELDAVRGRRVGDLPASPDYVGEGESDFSEAMADQLADLGYL